MMDITLVGVVLIFLSVGLNIQTAESCHCALHPQDQFCTSEIVILADVTRKGGSVKDKKKLYRYKIQLIKVLKGFINAKRIKYVYTDPSSCGITLDQGRYVLSGYQFKYGIEVEMCDLAERWDHLSLAEQENFKHTYKMGCDCTISTCSGSPCCPQSENECKWDAKSPHYLAYACLKDNDGYCSWYWQSSRIEEDEMCME
ncbi:metalloproteinase inhibitor 3-like [Triplophysa dalaica]|uniref:metalloproteinase inhibitor 3-like n=1 Tax=Triplophysa dalaica TaxID=1582913 RepID=UPI0024DF6A4F|nr:metalloproteinase inhibitor 3-like [Triplophysa dalaica]